MENLEEYLNANYNTVEALDGGGYYCEDSHHNGLYIPANYEGSVSMLGYLPGDGGPAGGYHDADMLREIIRGENPPDYICCISYTAYNENAENLFTQTYDSLTENLGLNIPTVCQMSFSASGGNGFTSLNNLLTEHPELNAFMIVNNSKNDVDQIKNIDNKYQALIDGNVPIFYQDMVDDSERINRLKTGINNGYNMYIIETTYDGHNLNWNDFHPFCNRDILYNGMVDYLFGYQDEYGHNSYYLKNSFVDYKLVTYNPETGEKIEVNIEDMITSNLAGVNIPSLRKLLSPGKFTITDNLVKNDQMGILGSLTDLKLNYRGQEVTSKYSYVESAMNSIRQQVSSSGYLSGYGTQNFRSTEGIPGCIGKYIDAYFSLVNQLLTDLSLQTESVLSYAQAMIDMDKHLAEGADELGSVLEVPNEDGAKPLNDYKPPRNTPDFYGNNPGNNNPGGNPPTVPETPRTRELKFNFEDNHNAILETDGEKIVSFRYYYKYDTAEAASAAMSELMKKFEGKDYFDRMEVKGNGINVYIKQEYLDTKSLDEIQNELLEGATIVNG